ncbi:MAG: hypothetical protein E6Q93_22715 [Burkholderiaceae bacterium]|nr:MAG: hypothetical protein E6Q93_22715 [Burkholderiaceae bacterium]
MKPALSCLLLAAALGAGLATPAQAEPGWSANLNLVSHYRFRGIDQTWGRPALQGGIDWNHEDGWYAGAWSSNVGRRSYPGGGAEVDLYAGYNGKIGDDWSFTAGLYGYLYPGASVRHARCPSAAFGAPCASLPGQRFDTLELNAGVGWKWLSYKLSVSATDYFGANTRTGYSRGTRGTLYHDLTLTVPLQDSLNLIVHAGYTDLRARYGDHQPSYADWRVALAKTFEGGWNASIGVVGATNDRMYHPPSGGLSATDGATRALNRTALVLQLGKSF